MNVSILRFSGLDNMVEGCPLKTFIIGHIESLPFGFGFRINTPSLGLEVLLHEWVFTDYRIAANLDIDHVMLASSCTEQGVVLGNTAEIIHRRHCNSVGVICEYGPCSKRCRAEACFRREDLSMDGDIAYTRRNEKGCEEKIMRSQAERMDVEGDTAANNRRHWERKASRNILNFKS